MSLHRPPSFALHVLLLVLVAFGLVMKPMLAAACDIADLPHAASPGSQAMSATPPAAGHAECCPAQQCGQCCVHVTVAAPAVQLASIEPPGSASTPMPARTVRPTPYPVALRPPIAT